MSKIRSFKKIIYYALEKKADQLVVVENKSTELIGSKVDLNKKFDYFSQETIYSFLSQYFKNEKAKLQTTLEGQPTKCTIFTKKKEAINLISYKDKLNNHVLHFFFGKHNYDVFVSEWNRIEQLAKKSSFSLKKPQSLSSTNQIQRPSSAGSTNFAPPPPVPNLKKELIANDTNLSLDDQDDTKKENQHLFETSTNTVNLTDHKFCQSESKQFDFKNEPTQKTNQNIDLQKKQNAKSDEDKKEIIVPPPIPKNLEESINKDSFKPMDQSLPTQDLPALEINKKSNDGSIKKTDTSESKSQKESLTKDQYGDSFLESDIERIQTIYPQEISSKKSDKFAKKSQDSELISPNSFSDLDIDYEDEEEDIKEQPLSFAQMSASVNVDLSDEDETTDDSSSYIQSKSHTNPPPEKPKFFTKDHGQSTDQEIKQSPGFAAYASNITDDSSGMNHQNHKQFNDNESYLDETNNDESDIKKAKKTKSKISFNPFNRAFNKLTNKSSDSSTNQNKKKQQQNKADDFGGKRDKLEKSNFEKDDQIAIFAAKDQDDYQSDSHDISSQTSDFSHLESQDYKIASDESQLDSELSSKIDYSYTDNDDGNDTDNDSDSDSNSYTNADFSKKHVKDNDDNFKPDDPEHQSLSSFIQDEDYKDIQSAINDYINKDEGQSDFKDSFGETANEKTVVYEDVPTPSVEMLGDIKPNKSHDQPTVIEERHQSLDNRDFGLSDTDTRADSSAGDDYFSQDSSQISSSNSILDFKSINKRLETTTAAETLFIVLLYHLVNKDITYSVLSQDSIKLVKTGINKFHKHDKHILNIISKDAIDESDDSFQSRMANVLHEDIMLLIKSMINNNYIFTNEYVQDQQSKIEKHGHNSIHYRLSKDVVFNVKLIFCNNLWQVLITKLNNQFYLPNKNILCNYNSYLKLMADDLFAEQAVYEDSDHQINSPGGLYLISSQRLDLGVSLTYHLFNTFNGSGNYGFCASVGLYGTNEYFSSQFLQNSGLTVHQNFNANSDLSDWRQSLDLAYEMNLDYVYLVNPPTKIMSDLVIPKLLDFSSNGTKVILQLQYNSAFEGLSALIKLFNDYAKSNPQLSKKDLLSSLANNLKWLIATYYHPHLFPNNPILESSHCVDSLSELIYHFNELNYDELQFYKLWHRLEKTSQFTTKSINQALLELVEETKLTPIRASLLSPHKKVFKELSKSSGLNLKSLTLSKKDISFNDSDLSDEKNNYKSAS